MNSLLSCIVSLLGITLATQPGSVTVYLDCHYWLIPHQKTTWSAVPGTSDTFTSGGSFSLIISSIPTSTALGWSENSRWMFTLPSGSQVEEVKLLDGTGYIGSAILKEPDVSVGLSGSYVILQVKPRVNAGVKWMPPRFNITLQATDDSLKQVYFRNYKATVTTVGAISCDPLSGSPNLPITNTVHANSIAAKKQYFGNGTSTEEVA